MKIKKNDKVIIIAGKDKGKIGKVLHALPDAYQLIVEGVNIKKRHQKPTKSNQKGQILDKTMPIHASNAMIVDSKSGKRTRIGKKLVDGKYVRFAKKSGALI